MTLAAPRFDADHHEAALPAAHCSYQVSATQFLDSSETGDRRVTVSGQQNRPIKVDRLPFSIAPCMSCGALVPIDDMNCGGECLSCDPRLGPPSADPEGTTKLSRGVGRSPAVFAGAEVSAE